VGGFLQCANGTTRATQQFQDSHGTHTNILSRVWLVGDFQIWYVSSDSGGEFIRRETHRVNVVRTQSQLIGGYRKVLGYRTQTVVDVHHWQSCVGFQETHMVA
jgi:hypothetical protein